MQHASPGEGVGRRGPDRHRASACIAYRRLPSTEWAVFVARLEASGLWLGER